MSKSTLNQMIDELYRIESLLERVEALNRDDPCFDDFYLDTCWVKVAEMRDAVFHQLYKVKDEK